MIRGIANEDPPNLRSAVAAVLRAAWPDPGLDDVICVGVEDIDALRSAYEATPEPALDRVVFGLAIAWRATRNRTIQMRLVDAYRARLQELLIPDAYPSWATVAHALDTYGLEES